MKQNKNKKKAEIAIDNVQKITEIESLKFGKLDAEIRNAIQSIQIANYKKQEYRLEYEAKCNKEDLNIIEINNILRQLRPQYEALIAELIKKYNIKDKDKLSIDPDTRIIQEI